MVALLVAFIAVLVLYSVIWRPLHDWSSAPMRQYQRQLAVLDWMRLHESEATRRGTTRQRIARIRLAADAGCELCSARRVCSCCVIRRKAMAYPWCCENQSFNSVIGGLLTSNADDHVTVKQISIDGQTRTRDWSTHE